jgi:hypothetical protein
MLAMNGHGACFDGRFYVFDLRLQSLSDFTVMFFM